MTRCLFVLCLALTGCATVTPSKYPLPTDPAVEYSDSELGCWLSALEWAEGDGDVYRVRSGSMIPTLFPGDYVVIREKPWAEFVPYKSAQYQAEWLPADAETVLHRIVGRDSGGLIMSGDANQFSETAYRVTERNAKGLLVGIWRVKP